MIVPQPQPRALSPVAASDGFAEPVEGGTAVDQPATARRWSFGRGGLGGLLKPSLTRRVVAINIVALLLPLAGFLYLGEYRRSLLQRELEVLQGEAETIAAALGAAASLTEDEGTASLPEQSAQLVRRLLADTRTAQLFDSNGDLLVDSRKLGARARAVIVSPLPPALPTHWIDRAFASYDRLWEPTPLAGPEIPWRRADSDAIGDFPEAIDALLGVPIVRSYGDGVLVAAVPVQQYRQVLGVLMLVGDVRAVDAAVRTLRHNILRISAVGLALTLLLSLYLASTITQPIRRLAAAAERVRHDQVHAPAASRPAERDGAAGGIPDFSARNDEIGELSVALREMTAALWQRLAATERFAADVAHELKNPLSSLRSAAEMIQRLSARSDTAEARGRLLRLVQVMVEDTQRLDRLISDISNLSRLDAEMAREEPELIDVGDLLRVLAEIVQATRPDDPVAASQLPEITVETPDTPVHVSGRGDRLMQVFRNLLDNAESFSPPGGRIRLAVGLTGTEVVATVADEGPGIPESNLERVFERFYSDRHGQAKFKSHSGLGLAISRQIIEAHGGRIRAEAPPAPERGARFVITLPRVVEPARG